MSSQRQSYHLSGGDRDSDDSDSFSSALLGLVKQQIDDPDNPSNPSNPAKRVGGASWGVPPSNSRASIEHGDTDMDDLLNDSDTPTSHSRSLHTPPHVRLPRLALSSHLPLLLSHPAHRLSHVSGSVVNVLTKLSKQALAHKKSLLAGISLFNSYNSLVKHSIQLPEQITAIFSDPSSSPNRELKDRGTEVNKKKLEPEVKKGLLKLNVFMEQVISLTERLQTMLHEENSPNSPNNPNNSHGHGGGGGQPQQLNFSQVVRQRQQKKEKMRQNRALVAQLRQFQHSWTAFTNPNSPDGPSNPSSLDWSLVGLLSGVESDPVRRVTAQVDRLLAQSTLQQYNPLTTQFTSINAAAPRSSPIPHASVALPSELKMALQTSFVLSSRVSSPIPQGGDEKEGKQIPSEQYSVHEHTKTHVFWLHRLLTVLKV